VRASYDTLINIFEQIENFFRRLEVYMEVSPTPEMTDMIVKIMVEVLSILALATKEIQHGRISESFLYQPTIAIDWIVFRKISEEAGRKDGHRRRIEEAGQAHN